MKEQLNQEISTEQASGSMDGVVRNLADLKSALGYDPTAETKTHRPKYATVPSNKRPQATSKPVDNVRAQRKSVEHKRSSSGVQNAVEESRSSRVWLALAGAVVIAVAVFFSPLFSSAQTMHGEAIESAPFQRFLPLHEIHQHKTRLYIRLKQAALKMSPDERYKQSSLMLAFAKKQHNIDTIYFLTPNRQSFSRIGIP